MGTAEEVHEKGADTPPPTPGNLRHLEYLASLDVDEDSFLCDPQAFLEQTYVTTSFSRFIRRHRTYWPMQNLTRADLDSRLLNLGSDWKPIFRGSVDLPSPADHRRANEKLSLSIHGRPNPGGPDWHDYNYDILIPLTEEHLYDPDRPMQAVFTRGHNLKTGVKNGTFIRSLTKLEQQQQIGPWDRLAYNSLSAPEYGENDPRVLIWAVQHAAADVVNLFHYRYGSRNGRLLRELPLVEVNWHDDYLEDDADEFMKKFEESKQKGIISGDSLVDLLNAA